MPQGEPMRALMIDALGSGKGKRTLTRDVIGCGPRWICGILEARGIECEIQLCEDFLAGKARIDVDLLLVSCMTMDIKALRKLGRKSLRRSPEATTIVGGPVASSPYRALEISGFDMAVVGEGEVALESILDGDEIGDIPGVFTRSGTAYPELPPRLDESAYNQYLPSTRRILDYPTYFASRVYVEVVRGCSNFNRTTMPLSNGRRCTHCTEGCRLPICPEGIPPGCGFCSVPAIFGPPKSRDHDLVSSEIGDLVELGVRRIVLSAPDILDYGRGRDLRDPTAPKPNYDALDRLLGGAARAAGDGASVSVENVKPSLLDDESAEIIADNLPSTSIHIGCETGDLDHSVSLGRPSAPGETMRAVRIARRHGLKPYVYFIHGLPGQSHETAWRTAELIRRMGKDVEKITAYRFKPLPGSAFEGEPTGPPSRSDEDSGLISRAAREVNLSKKGIYVGKTLEVVVAEPNFERKGQVIGFPVDEGPIVTMSGGRRLIGNRVKVRIRRAISDRLLQGEMVGVENEGA